MDTLTRTPGIHELTPDDVPTGSFVYGQQALDGDRTWRGYIDAGLTLVGGDVAKFEGDEQTHRYVICFHAICRDDKSTQEWAEAISTSPSQGGRETVAPAYIVRAAA